MIAQYDNLFQSSNTALLQGSLQTVILHTSHFADISVKVKIKDLHSYELP